MHLRHILGWDQEIPLRSLCQQLDAYSVLLSNESTAKGKIAATVPQLYQLISKTIPSQEFDMCKSDLASSNSVLVNDSLFVKPANVAFGSIDAQPYLFNLPAALTPFQQLFKEIGVRDKFVPLDYANVLSSMNTDFEQQELPSDLLRTALTLVQLLADSIIHEVPFVPSYNGKLVIASDLVMIRIALELP